MPDARPLRDRTAIVTGSTGEGMGRQIAWTLARQGANVVLNYGTYRASRTVAERAVAGAKRLGAEAIAVRADTRRESDVKRMVRAAERAFGRVDIAVANAGGDFIERPLERLTGAEWRKVIEAELDGAFLLAREVLPGMRRRKAGRIVFISWEGAGRSVSAPLDYSIGKLARDALAMKLARSEEAKGITINTVAPGYIPYVRPAEAVNLAHKAANWTRRKRSTTQDVAECVAWLASDEARFVTGSTIRVYGPS